MCAVYRPQASTTQTVLAPRDRPFEVPGTLNISPNLCLVSRLEVWQKSFAKSDSSTVTTRKLLIGAGVRAMRAFIL